MKSTYFAKCIDILTNNNQITVTFNTSIDNNFSKIYHVLIHESNAAVIKQLVKEGFSLFMTKTGLSVEYFES